MTRPEPSAERGPAPEVLARLAPADVAAVRALVERATTADDVGPLSEHVLLHLPAGGDDGVFHALMREDGRLRGYAHLDVTDQVSGSSAELVVDPDSRGDGVGRALVAALLDRTPDGRLRLWAHGDRPAAAALAGSLGFARTRVLLQMRRPLVEPVDAPTFPHGVRVRTFEPGRDDDAWLEVNRRAFASHPEQGRWTREELQLRLAEPWFDPAGFFLAERDGRLVGFHWTKVHGSDSPESHGHGPVGEVYVVGVDPAEQGNGLGAALTQLGLHSLQERGLTEVLLYVDESNAAAVRTYRRLGFTTALTDVCYARTA